MLALPDNQRHVAEPLLRAHLKDDPFDAAAIRMFAELERRIGRYRDAESPLRRAVELAPGFTPARANLYRLNRPVAALAELERVMAEEPDTPAPTNLQAAANARLGDFDSAIGHYERVLAHAPNQPRVWMSYGPMLKAVGRQTDAVAAHHRTTVRYTVAVVSAKVYGQATASHQSSAASDIRTAVRQTGTGAIVSPAQQLGRLEAFTTVGLAAGMTFERFNIELFVTNLTDARGQLSRRQQCGSCGQGPISCRSRRGRSASARGRSSKEAISVRHRRVLPA